MPRRHCKTCGNPLHADDTHTECVSRLGKSHADAAFSGAKCIHCDCFSLASLRSQLAFFRERLHPSYPPVSSQGSVRKKQWAGICVAGEKGEGESSVQAVQSHICTHWTCLHGGWTSGFSAALYGCTPGLPGQDARQWGSRSGCSFTQGPEERDSPSSTRHQSHRPDHRPFDV